MSFKEELREILTGVWASGVYDQADGEGDCITDDTPVDPEEALTSIINLVDKEVIGQCDPKVDDKGLRFPRWVTRETLREEQRAKLKEKAGKEDE